MDALWRAQRDAARRVIDVWGQLLCSSALGSGRRQEVQDQLQALVRSASDYAGAAIGPVRDLVRGQRELAERMARWAQLQHELADQVAEWARIQRGVADALERMLPPFDLPGDRGKDGKDTKTSS